MADINQRLPAGNDPSFMNYSQGTDRAQPNRAFESLFSGVGNTVGIWAEQKDKENKAAIENEVYQGVDPIRNSQGLDNSVNGVMPPTTTMPQGARDASSSAQKLTEAYNAGKINETYYWSRIEALSRQTRNRYPGYREEVDQAFSKVTGSNPANALRRSILNDLEQAQSQSQSRGNREEAFYLQNLEYMSPATRAAVANRTANFTAVVAEVGQAQSNQKAIQVEKDKLALADAQGSATSKQAISAVDQEVSHYLNDKVSGLGDVIQQYGIDLGKLTEGGKLPSPEEVNQMKAIGARMKLELQTYLKDTMTKPLGPGTTATYSSVIADSTKERQILEKYTGYIDNMIDQVTNGQYGAANANFQYAKMTKDADVARALQQNDTLRKMQLIREIGGENALGLLNTADNGRFLGQSVKAFGDLQVAKVNTFTGATSFNQTITDLKKNGQDNPQVYKELVESTRRMLADRSQDPRLVARTATAVFANTNVDFLNQFNPSERMDIYSMFTSPEVTRNLTEIRGNAPEVWNNYKNWALTSFGALYKSELSDAKDAIEVRPYTTVSYNNQTNQLSIAVSSEGRRQMERFGFGTNSAQSSMIQGATESVRKINMGLNNLKPILEADGQKAGQVIPRTLEALGVNPTATKQDSLFNKVNRAIVEGAEAMSTNLAGGEKDPSRAPGAPGTSVNVLDAVITGWNRPNATGYDMNDLWGGTSMAGPNENNIFRRP